MWVDHQKGHKAVGAPLDFSKARVVFRDEADELSTVQERLAE